MSTLFPMHKVVVRNVMLKIYGESVWKGRSRNAESMEFSLRLYTVLDMISEWSWTRHSGTAPVQQLMDEFDSEIL